MHWYKRDPAAALVGMSTLTLEERGAYNTLIDYYYSCKGRVPDDDYSLSRVMRCDPRTWRRLKINLFKKQKVTVRDGLLIPNRGEYTLREAEEFSEKQRRRAKVRWQSDKKPNEINDPIMPLHAMPIQPQPQPQPQRKKKRTAAQEPPEFIDFWNSIPDRGAQRHNRHTALLAYLGAVEEGADVFQINAAAKRWYRENLDTKEADRKYIPQATTWLNQKRFLDYHTKPEQESNLEYDSDAKTWKWKAGHEPQTTG